MYWTEKGSQNTDKTIALALERARELNLRHLVVASHTGATAKKVLKSLSDGQELVCVTHHAGYPNPSEVEITPETRQGLQEQGVKVLTTTHLLSGIESSMRAKFKGVYPTDIVAMALRLLGQGFKVCVEISVMALDAGLIPYNEEVIVIGGTSQGADTACVITPAHSNNFFDTVVKEIICMPRG